MQTKPPASRTRVPPATDPTPGSTDAPSAKAGGHDKNGDPTPSPRTGARGTINVLAERILHSRLGPWLPALAGVLVLVPHALYFNFVNDDAYISFRYARNLAEHGALVFNLGERVEGYTNFLWTLLLAAGLKLGAPPEIASRVMGLGFGIAGIFIVGRISRLASAGRTQLGHVIAPLLMGASSAYACWCTGGLETQLFVALALCGTWRLLIEVQRGSGFISAVAFALAAMTRPEGLVLFALGAAFRPVARLYHQGRRWPGPREVVFAATFVGLFALIYGPYFLWRWNYYGWPFPNTYYVKAFGDPLAAAKMGAYYMRRFAEDHAAWFAALLILAAAQSRRWSRRQSQRQLQETPNHMRRELPQQHLPAHAQAAAKTGTLVRLWALGLISFYTLYAIKVGGDFMGLYRFVLLIIPLGALLVQESLMELGAALRPWVGRPVLAIAALCLAAAQAITSFHMSHTAMTVVGADRGIDTPAYLAHYVEERLPIGKWLARHARPDDLMTLGGAGVMAYHAGIRGYDIFGLVDETIAHDPSMTVGSRPGHQKWGAEAYMLSRKPTLITHLYRIHAPYAPNPEYWRARGYEWVTATIEGLSDPPLFSFLKRIDRAFGPFPASKPAP